LAKKPKGVYICQSCGYQSGKWLGRCPDCGGWDSFIEEIRVQPSRKPGAQGDPRHFRSTGPLKYEEIESQDDARIPTGCREFDRVLGGGVVPGSLVLIGGEPGVGKSTLLLQTAAAVAQKGTPVLYVSGEESDKQLKLRGQRLGINGSSLYVMSETHLEQIEAEISRLRPALVVADSIQTIYTSDLDSAPGNLSQIRECATRFLFLAKSTGIPFFLIGHINKEGSIAGPKALEHIVDTVLYFEGERRHNHRIVRAVKNRFGAANEVGVYEMTGKGLEEVTNPSALFLAERPGDAAGAAVICSIVGSRPILVEVQALVSLSNFSAGRRMAQGFDRNRVSLLLAMLERTAGLNLLGIRIRCLSEYGRWNGSVGAGGGSGRSGRYCEQLSQPAFAAGNHPHRRSRSVWGDPVCSPGGPASQGSRIHGISAMCAACGKHAHPAPPSRNGSDPGKRRQPVFGFSLLIPTRTCRYAG